MGDKSKIEWTDATWNPIRARNLATGKIGWHCEHVSEACRNCYAEGMNRRLGSGLDFKPGHRSDVEIFLDEKMLLAPLRWKTSRRIFVNSMTDTFAEFVKDEWLDRMFAVMALAPQHTFQVLTKRPERMREYFPTERRYLDVDPLEDRWNAINEAMNDIAAAHWCKRELGDYGDIPFPNVWLGISAEDQATADERIPPLLQTPAAVRFVSLEPLLGPINLKHIRVADHGWQDVLEGWRDCRDYPGRENLIDWVIVGGESGAQARPLHPNWTQSLREQCAMAGTPFFFKQWGEWAPHTVMAGGDLGGDVRAGRVRIVHPNGQTDVEVSEITGGHSTIPGSRYMARVGKKLAGRLLDGVEHNGMPGAPS